MADEEERSERRRRRSGSGDSDNGDGDNGDGGDMRETQPPLFTQQREEQEQADTTTTVYEESTSSGSEIDSDDDDDDSSFVAMLDAMDSEEDEEEEGDEEDGEGALGSVRVMRAMDALQDEDADDDDDVQPSAAAIFRALLGIRRPGRRSDSDEFMTQEELQQQRQEMEARAASPDASNGHDDDDDDSVDDDDDDVDMDGGQGSSDGEATADEEGDELWAEYSAAHPNAQRCSRITARQLRRRVRGERSSVKVSAALKGSELHRDVGRATGATSVRLHNHHNTTAIRYAFLRGRLGLKGLNRPHRTFLAREHLPNRHAIRQCAFSQHVFCGTYSEDGAMFMSACQDDVLRLYDTRLDSWELKRSIHARDVGWAVVDTCYSPNQEYLIYSSWSPAIRLITLEGDRHEDLVYNETYGHTCPFSIRFSQDSSEIVAGLNGGSVIVYDINLDRLHHRIDAHDDDVNAVAFADASTNILISGSDDALCKVWDRRTMSTERPRPVKAFRGHTHGITFIDAKGDGNYFISQGKDSAIKLWDIRAAPSNQTAPRIEMSDYRWAVNRRTQRRRLRGDVSLMTYRGHIVTRTLLRARFSPAFSTGQRYIYSGCTRGRVYIWDTLTGDVLSHKGVHDSIVRDVSWHPYKPVLTSSAWDGTVVSSSFTPGD